jgi:branched-chain amino acid transport system permease protein
MRWIAGSILVGAAALAVTPFLVSSYVLSVLVKMFILALFAMSYDFLLGYIGLASLGQVAFFGISAYAVALSARAGIDSSVLQIAIGLLAAVGLALIFGPISLRVRGVYHMMITLALAQLLWGIAYGWRSVTGGDDGLAGIKPPSFGVGPGHADIALYFFVLVMCVLGALGLYALTRSPFGKVLVGIRENEQRMGVLGYNVKWYQLVGIVVSALGTGFAGILYAYSTGYVGVSYLSVALGADVLLMVILGGIGTLFGPAIGAVVIVTLQTFISHETERWILILGCIYIAVVFWAPKGLIGILRPAKAKARR